MTLWGDEPEEAIQTRPRTRVEPCACSCGCPGQVPIPNVRFATDCQMCGSGSHRGVRLVRPTTSWISFADRLDVLMRSATARNSQKGGYESTRNWASDTHFVGLCGEQVYATLTGQKVDLTLRKRGDSGHDFPRAFAKGGREYPGTINIKASTHWDDPWLKAAKGDILVADWYGLVGIDLQRSRGWYVGMVSRQQFLDAPLVDWGRGESRSLSPSQIAELAVVIADNFSGRQTSL